MMNIDKEEERKANIAWWVVMVVCFILLGFILFSCSRTVYVPVESVRTEYKDKLIHDSIYRYDSVLVKLKGDTVWLEKYRYIYKDRFVHDSILINDTIRVPYPVEKMLSRWEAFKVEVGGITIGAIFILLIIIVWLAIKR